MRVAVTEPGHRDPAGEIEEFAPVGGIKVGALAPIDGDIPATVGRHNGWYHGISPARLDWGKSAEGRTIVVADPPPARSSAPIPNAGLLCRDRTSALSLPRRGRLADPCRQPEKQRSMRMANSGVNSRRTGLRLSFSNRETHAIWRERALIACCIP